MGKYGQAAITAMNLTRSDKSLSPKEAWELATTEIFGAGKSGQRKGCPKGAFLGLCEAGLLIGVAPGRYCNSEHNKSYALKAVDLLKAEPQLANDSYRLWDRITHGAIVHNGQLDVVLSLWKNNLIIH